MSFLSKNTVCEAPTFSRAYLAANLETLLRAAPRPAQNFSEVLSIIIFWREPNPRTPPVTRPPRTLRLPLTELADQAAIADRDRSIDQSGSRTRELTRLAGILAS